MIGLRTRHSFAQFLELQEPTVSIVLLPQGPACPLCGSATRQRTGKNGPFWSCSRYPDCKGTVPVDSATPKRSAPRKRRSSPKAS